MLIPKARRGSEKPHTITSAFTTSKARNSQYRLATEDMTKKGSRMRFIWGVNTYVENR